MLTDLTFLQMGKPWPPECETERINMYSYNKDLFEGEHATVYKEAFERITRVVGNFEKVVSYPMLVNYQRLMSLKVADLLFGEVPKIVAGKNDSAEQLAVDTIIRRTNVFNTGYESAIDISRYGDGLLYVYDVGNGKGGMVDVAQPPLWFPVVDPFNIKRFTHHVLAWVYKDGEFNFLRVRVHEIGQYTEMIFRLNGVPSAAAWVIGDMTEAAKVVPTHLSDFAVVPIPNVITSDRVHGLDDYTNIDSIVSELLVRLSQVSKILDKHADPSMSGPHSALDRDPDSGEYTLKLGNYFVRDGKDDAEPKYIVWDASLDANFKDIELLINLLHAMSEMGSSLLGDKGDEVGTAPSGTSLRFRMISPLAKVKRIAMRFKPALEKVIVLCSELGGEGVIPLTKTPISITFQDGLPNDPVEESTIMMNRTGNKPTMSIKTAIMTFDNKSEADADNELAEIIDEEAALNPIANVSTPFNGNNDPNANGGGGQ